MIRIISPFLLLAFSTSAFAMSVMVETGEIAYTVSGQDTNVTLAAPGPKAAGDGKLIFSAEGDFDHSGENLTLGLDGVFSRLVGLGLPGMISITCSPVFGEDAIEAIFTVPQALLNDIIANGSVEFQFDFDQNVGVAPGSHFEAALMYPVSVPEPATFTLVGLAAAVAGGSSLTRRRRRMAIVN